MVAGYSPVPWEFKGSIACGEKTCFVLNKNSVLTGCGKECLEAPTRCEKIENVISWMRAVFAHHLLTLDWCTVGLVGLF